VLSVDVALDTQGEGICLVVYPADDSGSPFYGEDGCVERGPAFLALVTRHATKLKVGRKQADEGGGGGKP
jgi:hypothetical protein